MNNTQLLIIKHLLGVKHFLWRYRLRRLITGEYGTCTLYSGHHWAMNLYRGVALSQGVDLY